MILNFLKTQVELNIISLVSATISFFINDKKISFLEHYFNCLIFIQYLHFSSTSRKFIGNSSFDSNGFYIPSKWYIQLAKILLSILYLPDLVIGNFIYKYFGPTLYKKLPIHGQCHDRQNYSKN